METIKVMESKISNLQKCMDMQPEAPAVKTSPEGNHVETSPEGNLVQSSPGKQRAAEKTAAPSPMRTHSGQIIREPAKLSNYIRI